MPVCHLACVYKPCIFCHSLQSLVCVTLHFLALFLVFSVMFLSCLPEFPCVLDCYYLYYPGFLTLSLLLYGLRL